MQKKLFRKAASYFLASVMAVTSIQPQAFAEESFIQEEENAFFDSFSEDDWYEEPAVYEEQPVIEEQAAPVFEEEVPEEIQEENPIQEVEDLSAIAVPEEDLQEFFEEEIPPEEIGQEEDLQESAPSQEDASQEEEDVQEEIQVQEMEEEDAPVYVLSNTNGSISVDVRRKDNAAFPDGISVHVYSFDDMTSDQKEEEKNAAWNFYEDALLDAFMEEYGARERFDFAYDIENFAGSSELLSEHWVSFKEEYRKAFVKNRIYAVSIYDSFGNVLPLDGYVYTITAADVQNTEKIADGKLWIDFYTFDREAKASYIKTEDFDAYYNKDEGNFFVTTEKIDDRTDGVFAISLSDAQWSQPEISWEDIESVHVEDDIADEITLEDLMAEDPEFYEEDEGQIEDEPLEGELLPDAADNPEDSETVFETEQNVWETEEQDAETEKEIIEIEEPDIETEKEIIEIEEPVIETEEQYIESEEAYVETEEPVLETEERPVFETEEAFFETEELPVETEEEFSETEAQVPETEETFFETEPVQTEYIPDETEKSETLITEYSDVTQPSSQEDDTPESDFDEKQFIEDYVREELSDEDLYEEGSEEEETEDLYEELTEEESEEDTEDLLEETEENLFEEETEEGSEEELFEEESEDESEEGEIEYEDLTLLPLVEVEESAAEGLLAASALTRATRLMAANRGVSAPPTQDPITEDGMTIEKITIKWLSKSHGESEPAGYGTLSLVPTTDDVPNQQWQIDFALSGKHEHEAGSIEVVIPAYIWKTRDGEEPGILTLSVPEDPETGADFAWRRVGDSIVFTNTRNLSAATKVMIQGTFREVTAHEMVDVDVAPESDFYNSEYPGVSDKLYATINLVVPNGDTISMTSNEIDATIDTYVQAAGASKTAYNPTLREYYSYWDVPSNMPSSFLPANPEDYVYVRWYVSGIAQGNQPFVMSVTDNTNDEYGCIVLGVQKQSGGNVKSEDGISVTAQLFDGYSMSERSAYVWTAYEKSYFTEPFTLYTVHNTQTISVQGWDDMLVTTRQASAACSFAIPIQYRVIKQWSDDDNAEGKRPSYQNVNIWRNPQGNNVRTLWKTVRLVENPTPAQIAEGYGTWSYTWSDEGKAWHYETGETNMASGSYTTYYDENGYRHSKTWHYGLLNSDYMPQAVVSDYADITGEDPNDDSLCPTWIYTNRFYVTTPGSPGGYDGYGGVNGNTMTKRVWSQYDDPKKQSKRDRALNELMKGYDAIIPYNVTGEAGSYGLYARNVQNGYFASEQSILNDTEKMDVILEDYYDEINNQVITLDDLDLAYIDLNVPSIYVYTQMVKDPNKPEGDPERYYDPPRYTLSRMQDRYVTSSYEAMVDGEWVSVGELAYNAASGKMEVTPANGATVTNNGSTSLKLRLNLPEHTEQFREIAHSYGATCVVKYTVGVRVHPSEFVLGQIEMAAALDDYMMMTVDNYAKLYTMTDGTRSSWERKDWDRGYLHGRIYRVAAWQSKSFRVTENDVVNRRLKIHTKAKTTQQSNVLVEDEYWFGVRGGDIPHTDGGTWYDLLPYGVIPDLSTITLQNGDHVLNAYTVENYQGTGRILLVVEASLGTHLTYSPSRSSVYANIVDEDHPFPRDNTYPQEGFRQEQVLEFDSYYSWEDAKNNGLETIRNTVAFETNDDEIGTLNGWMGEPDDPRFGNNKKTEEEVRTDLDYMTELDPDRDDPAFVYAGANLIAEELDFYAETSIRKWVSAEGSGIWSYGHYNEAIVYEGGKYTYRINLTSDSETTTKDIIILDSLENYIPTSDKSDYGDAQWRGYLRYLDITPIYEAGIAPVVYYSTTPNLDIARGTAENPNYNYDEDYDVIAQILQTSPDWIPASDYHGDMKDVTAFAVDCRYKTDGTVFELDEGQSLSFYAYMRAPAKRAAEDIWGAGKDAPADPQERDPSNPDHNAHAYNNIYLDCTQIDGIGRETHAYIHWDYVKVGIVPFNLHITKQWDDMDDNDGKRPQSVTVRLYADGVATPETVTLDDSNDWTGIIEHVLRYDYDTTDSDYAGLDDGHYIMYTFREEPAVEGYEMAYDFLGDQVDIVNVHEPEKISIPFTKIWEGEDELVPTRPASIAVKLYADGVYTGSKKTVRANVEGEWSGEFTNLYRYKEGHEIVYTLEEEEVTDYITSYAEGTITNTYYPFGDLIVSKTLENATAAAAENFFTFTLTLKDPENNTLTDQYAYKIYDEEDEVVSEGEIGNGGDFQLKGGWRIEVKDIPSHTVYNVKETTRKGFRKTSEGESGTIRSNKPCVAAFTNTYSSNGKLMLNASKVLSGRYLEKNQFKYTVKRVIDENTKTDAATASCKADGTIDFGGIKFTDADDGQEFVFEITERDDGKPGYTYDDSVITVKVVPHDQGDGTIDFEIHYFDEEESELFETSAYVFPDRFEMGVAEYEALTPEEVEDLTLAHQRNDFNPEEDTVKAAVLTVRRPALFSNEYHASGDISLLAWKQMTGRALAGDDFTFNLYSEERDGNGNNELLQTKTNTQDGSIIWDSISYDEEDVGKTFYYFVKEVPGNDTDMVYDGRIYGYKVVVFDNGDGTLSFNQTHVYANEFPNGNASVSFRRYIYRCRFAPLSGTNKDYEYPASLKDTFLSIEETLTSSEPVMVSDDLTFFEKAYVLQNPNGLADDFDLTDAQMEALIKSTFDIDKVQANKVYIGSNEENPSNSLFNKAFDDDEDDGTTYKVFLYKADCQDTYFEPAGDMDGVPVFENSLKPGSLSLTKLSQWHEGDTPDENQKFRFVIILTNPDGTPMEGTFEYVPEQVENNGEMASGNGSEPETEPETEP